MPGKYLCSIGPVAGIEQAVVCDDTNIEHGERDPGKDFHGERSRCIQSATNPRNLQLCQREHTKG